MKYIDWKQARRRAAAGCAWVMAVMLLFTGWELKAYGANDSSVIESLTVNVKTTYGEPEEIPQPEITVSGTGCSLGDIQYQTDYDRWKPGKKVRIELTVHAEDGKVFPVSLTRSQCKVTGADFVSARALDDGSLQVKVNYKPVTVLGDTTKAGWSSKNSGRAVWKSVEYATGYSLVLYGDDKVVKRLTLDTNSVDLTDFMKDDEKTYTYEVKAIPRTSEEKKYLKEGNFVASTESELDWSEVDNVGTNDGGSVKGNTYVRPDGRKETNTWKKISGFWYYFDQNGNMAKGWQAVDGFWYYMDAAGRMQTGWVNPDGNWYYLLESGGMAVGWLQPEPGIWYYLDGSGRMCRGWNFINGKWYYLNPDSGRMHTGWLLENGQWRYLFSDGSMAVNGVIDGWRIGPDGIAVPEA